MQPIVLALLVIVTQLLFFSAVAFRLLWRAGRAADEAAALALCLSPVAQAGAIVIGIAFGWRLTAIPVLSAVALGLTMLLRPGEFLRQPVVRAWALVALCWLGQEALVRCHGGAFWAWDWEAHWEIATAVIGRMRGGSWPIVPGRTALFGVWGAPALSVAPQYPTFQITTILANSLAVPAAWLWASRWGGRRGALAAVGMVLLCAGLTQSAVYTWPKAGTAALVLAAMYLWMIDWQVLAGLTFAAAFHAHQSAVAYTIPFFVAVLYFGIRQYPWRMASVYAIAMGLWLFVLHNTFPEKWSATPYFIWPGVTVARQLSATLSYFAGTFFFVGWLDGLRGPYAFHAFARAGTDAWLATVPIVGTVALACAARGLRRAEAPSLCIGLALLAGGTLTWLVLQDARNMVIQSTLAPLLLAALAAGGAASTSLPAAVAVPLWLLSGAQFLVFRLPLLWANIHYPDAYNLGLKQKAGIPFLADRSELFRGAIASPVAITAGITLFLLVLRNARDTRTAVHPAATETDAGRSGIGPQRRRSLPPQKVGARAAPSDPRPERCARRGRRRRAQRAR